jgi:hypothetical protein
MPSDVWVLGLFLHRGKSSFDLSFKIFWACNNVSTVEDAEPSGLCQLTLKYPKHFV